MEEDIKMKARIQVGLVKLSNPRVIRIAMVGLALALALLGHPGVAFAEPSGGDGGCGGG
jgi:hypothetical protein